MGNRLRYDGQSLRRQEDVNAPIWIVLLGTQSILYVMQYQNVTYPAKYLLLHIALGPVFAGSVLSLN